MARYQKLTDVRAILQAWASLVSQLERDYNTLAGAGACRTVTATDSITDNDTVVIVDCTTGSFTVTLPSAIGRKAKRFVIKRADNSGNTVTVAAPLVGGVQQKLDGANSQALDVQFKSFDVTSDNSSWYIV
jgi:hypothetical protein